MIRGRRSRWSVVLAGLVAAVVGSSCSSEAPRARTYFETLDLSSPEVAVGEFAEAFASDNFFRVWLILDRETQADIMSAIQVRAFGDLVDTGAFDDFEKEWLTRGYDSSEAESFDAWYYFDQLMLFADSNDALMFDLPAEGTFSAAGPDRFSTPSPDGGYVVIETRLTGDRWHIWRVSVNPPAGDTTVWPGTSEP